MNCACQSNNGPAFIPEPHMIPGYMGYVPQLKFRFGNGYAEQTHRLYLDPTVNMSPRAVLTDICPEDCSTGSFMQNATGYKLGNCGCENSQKSGRDPSFTQGRNRGASTQAPRFQTIMNHTYAPFCNRFCTKTFEQDQWRDKLFTREKEAMDGWRYCYKSKPWDRPERLSPWDGDNSEFRRTQTTILPPMMKDDIDIHLRGYDGISRAGGPCGSYNAQSSASLDRRYKAATQPMRSGGSLKGPMGDNCPPCELYQRHYKGVEKAAADAGLAGIVKHPLFPTPQGHPIRDVFCEDIRTLEQLNKEQMSRSPYNAVDGVIEELGELPILTLHKLAQKKEDTSGKYYPEERGLARVCNPIGSSYLTARPFRCSAIYRYCEPVSSTYAGHVPGEIFVHGEHRGKATRNALKYMTFRI